MWSAWKADARPLGQRNIGRSVRLLPVWGIMKESIVLGRGKPHTGIGPAFQAWEARVLPLDQCGMKSGAGIEPATPCLVLLLRSRQGAVLYH